MRVSGRVDAALPAVARWWTDDRRVLEWRRDLEAHYRVPIEWHEHNDAETSTQDAEWQTRRGSVRYRVVRDLPRRVRAGEDKYELRRTMTSEITSLRGRRSRSQAQAVIHMTARAAASTEIIYEQSWETTSDFAFPRVPALEAFRWRRSAKAQIRRCAAEVHAEDH